MKESGQLHRMHKKWYSRFRKDCHPEEIRPLAIKDVFAVFVMLLVAFVMSTVLFYVEKIYSIYLRKKLNHEDDEDHSIKHNQMEPN